MNAFIVASLLSLVNSFDICTESNYDLCLGFSGNATVGRQLQLKTRHRRIESGDVFYWNSDCDDSGGFCIYGANGTMLLMDKLRQRIHAGLSRTSSGVIYDNGRLRLQNSSLCVSVVECANGGGEFCNPNSVRMIRQPYQVKAGTYIAMKPCVEGNLTLAQNFVLNPPCRKGCDFSLLFNEDCDQECNYAECFWDLGSCNSTYSPTKKRFKSKKPTLAPTVLPSVLPTLNPTPNPTVMPTESPSVKPSALPTEQSTFHPTLQPAEDGYEYVTRKPTFQPSVSPTRNPSRNPTMKPILPPTGVEPPPKPNDATESPTGTGPADGLSEAGFLTLVILLPLLGLILIIVVIYVLWKRRQSVQHPQTALPRNPPSSDTTPGS